MHFADSDRTLHCTLTLALQLCLKDTKSEISKMHLKVKEVKFP